MKQIQYVDDYGRMCEIRVSQVGVIQPIRMGRERRSLAWITDVMGKRRLLIGEQMQVVVCPAHVVSEPV